jgi:hypothetical protein
MATQPPPPADIGFALIAARRMPGADTLTASGAPAWTWGSFAAAFRCDPNELAALLQPAHHETQNKQVGEHRVIK